MKKHLLLFSTILLAVASVGCDRAVVQGVGDETAASTNSGDFTINPGKDGVNPAVLAQTNKNNNQSAGPSPKK